MHPFYIDSKTGTLGFPTLDATVERLSSWNSLPQALKSRILASRNMSTGWAWPILSEISFENYPIGLSFGYNNRRLEMLSFSLLRPPNEADPQNIWPTYEEAIEEEKILRAAMEKHLGVSLGEHGSAQFKWGSVYCSYHPKDGATSAGVNYTFFR